MEPAAQQFDLNMVGASLGMMRNYMRVIMVPRRVQKSVLCRGELDIRLQVSDWGEGWILHAMEDLVNLMECEHSNRWRIGTRLTMQET